MKAFSIIYKQVFTKFKIFTLSLSYEIFYLKFPIQFYKLQIFQSQFSWKFKKQIYFIF